MHNRDADAAPVPATDAEAVTAAGVTRLKDLVADSRRMLGVAVSLEQMAERSMSIMTAYLAGELPPAIAAQVTDLLRTEPLFRAAHANLLAAWQAPNAERVVSGEEVDAAYSRFKAMRAAKFGAVPGSSGA